MLEHLHVKNLALIREAEIDFTEGLNILTGETGAGKSIVIGSVSLALGGKVSKDLVRPERTTVWRSWSFLSQASGWKAAFRSWTWFRRTARSSCPGKS